MITPFLTLLCRHSCGIDMSDHLVVTGGYGHRRTVAKYNESGLIDYLPSLNQGRYNHACSSFISASGETVEFILFIINLIINYNDPDPDGHRGYRRNIQQN